MFQIEVSPSDPPDGPVGELWCLTFSSPWQTPLCPLGQSGAWRRSSPGLAGTGRRRGLWQGAGRSAGTPHLDPQKHNRNSWSSLSQTDSRGHSTCVCTCVLLHKHHVSYMCPLSLSLTHTHTHTHTCSSIIVRTLADIMHSWAPTPTFSL